MNVLRRNIVSLLALFVALSGTGYAAATLHANSVGTRQLRNHSVTPAKLAKTAKPLTVAQLRDVITSVVTDPATGVDITVHGETGDTGAVGATGPQGDPGHDGAPGAAGPQGPKGDTGDQGLQGPSGSAYTFGYVAADGTPDVHGEGASIGRPASVGVGDYCLANGHIVSLTVTPAVSGGTAVVIPAFAAANNCQAGAFEVIVSVNGSPTDAGFYFAGN